MEGGGAAVQDRRLIAVNKIFADLPNTIFDVMSQAARDLNALMLRAGRIKVADDLVGLIDPGFLPHNGGVP